MTVQAKETRNVFSDNSVVFMLDLEEAIHDGFRVENTIAGYPALNAILKEVRVFRSDVPSVKTDRHMDAVEIIVSNYDPMVFLLEVQEAILEGFEIDQTRVNFNTHGIKTCGLIRSEATPELVLDPIVFEAPAVADTPKVADKPKPKAKTAKPRKGAQA